MNFTQNGGFYRLVKFRFSLKALLFTENNFFNAQWETANGVSPRTLTNYPFHDLTDIGLPLSCLRMIAHLRPPFRSLPLPVGNTPAHAGVLDSAGAFDDPRIAAARELGCHTLYTEDLNHGQNYEGVRVINPFL